MGQKSKEKKNHNNYFCQNHSRMTHANFLPKREKIPGYFFVFVEIPKRKICGENPHFRL
jgi:hypothetical protein|tara:strand:- start:255 stop:431 length:177 start_codon:yes stop_codon:yes gene_type:complete